MSDVISFAIQADPMHSWKSWGHNQYPSVADVICELVDNSLQAKTGKHGAHVNIYKDTKGQRWVKIEDGGKWPPITAETLKVCFGYGTIGDENKSGLNEHNCGLKNSLAYLDPKNSRWMIQIRQNGVVWQLQAPYNTQMSITKSDTYIGELDLPDSTIIKVPLDDTQFKTLYERSVNGTPNDDLLNGRLKEYLSTMWMMRREIVSKETPIYFNGNKIEPYSFNNEKEAEVFKYASQKITLGDDYPIELEAQRVYLRPAYKKTHPVFKRSIEHAGVYIFRDGRLINKDPLFKEIYGKVRDGHYSGWVLLVNVIGDARGLPDTVTTKNGFSSQDPKIDQLYTRIRDICEPSTTKTIRDENAPVVERELVRRLVEIKKKANDRRVKKGTYDIREEQNVEVASEGIRLVNKDKIDMLEIDKDEKIVTICEAKKTLEPVPNLRQLFWYYRNLKHFSSEFRDYEIECKIILPYSQELPQCYNDELLMIQKYDPDFNPTIEDFASYGIYPQ